ncbi:Anaerobic selenocysteine-containing dehydrogenase [Modicisalibacter ilicicola DSM 19980]|uniref:Anaerobic selenocysteine-containing dehydrogenase n=2 Tax=Modicisalibacter ilicicola TaxID=480814 RepID=A0A1M4SMH5_9GAMM|nr:Anaerobic selenocysteine-containing dehydrogenase [Halomonas ilicicola DSM 19980]
MSDVLSLSIDLERCTGCKSCEAACKQANGLGPHSYRNRVLWFAAQNVDAAESTPQALLDFLTVTCQQCERPACLRACPVNPKAISKDPVTGVVAINEDRCTGCGECAISCPYGAIGYNAEHHHAVKCDLCAHRRAVGDGPACASVCPTQAIRFGRTEDHLVAAEAAGREVLDIDHFLQRPATVYLKRRADEGLDAAEHHERHGTQRIPALMLDDEVRGNLDRSALNLAYDAAARERVADAEVVRVPGGCPICFNGCPVVYELQGERLGHVYGNKEDPVFEGRICPKSQMTLQMHDAKERLRHPLKRVGARGEGRFERITWEQALDEIAARLGALREMHGADSLAIHSGSRTGTLTTQGCVPLFANLWGTDNVATTEPFCDLSKVVALEMTQGSVMMTNVYTPEDIGSAALYVYIGDNQAETRPVNFGLVNQWRMRNGARLVVVDPRATATAAKADDWLPIRPGTDMALGLAMIGHILDRDLHDAAFCEAWIEGFEAWRAFIRTQGYTPEWAAPITDLPAERIACLAEAIADADGAMLMLSRGVNQHTNAAQTHRVFMFLAAITGNWGRRGGGYFNVSSEPDVQAPQVPEARRPPRRPAICKNPAGWADAMLGEAAYPIRGLITGNNPLALWPDQNRMREAVSHLDLLVHLELYRNATSAFADYLLPMASGIEKGGTTRLAEDRRIVWNDKLIEPPGEARSDHWFWIELGKRCGFGDLLKEEYKDPRRLWDEVLCRASPTLRGATTRRLLQKANRSLRVPLADEEAPETDTLYLEGTTAFGQVPGKRFPTPSGKLEFHTPALVEHFATLGLSPLPEFYSEAASSMPLPYFVNEEERIVSPFFAVASQAVRGHIAPATQATGRDGMDVELVTGRPPAPHFHSWTHYFWQAQEMWPELYCQIHPRLADSLEIHDGDRVRITTRTGQIEARAWRYAGMRERAIFIPIGWDERQPFHPGPSINHLTQVRLDPISQQANLKLTMCRVENGRWQGKSNGRW